jgi:hypothetical protein
MRQAVAWTGMGLSSVPCKTVRAAGGQGGEVTNDPERRIANLFEAFADDVERMSDEELIAECIEYGEDPTEIANRTRRLLQETLDRFKARTLAEGR